MAPCLVLFSFLCVKIIVEKREKEELSQTSKVLRLSNENF